jgi:hypothetical protein
VKLTARQSKHARKTGHKTAKFKQIGSHGILILLIIANSFPHFYVWLAGSRRTLPVPCGGPKDERKRRLIAPQEEVMRFSTYKLAITAALLRFLVSPAVTQAQLSADRDRSKIVMFDVPGAGKTAGALNCGNNLLTGCYGTTPMANNNAGEIVGMYLTDDGVYYGFLRNADGKTKSFTAPGADTTDGDFNGTYPMAINSCGAVTGTYQGMDEVFHGFLREPNGSYVQIDVAEAGTAAFQGTWPASINDKGDVAGFYFDASGTHGFVRSQNGTITRFSNPNAANGTYVALEQGLNDDGAIVGWYFDANFVAYGYVREPDGTFKTVEPDASSPSTLVGGINRSGASTGYYADTTGLFYGFLRKKDGTTTDFQASGEDAVEGLVAFTLNCGDEITGVTVDSNNANHGFVRFANGKIKSFDAASPNTGTGSNQGTRPTTINDAREVIGYYVDEKNVSHGFIRYPSEDDVRRN